MKRYVLAMSGASGSIIGVRVLEELVKTSEVYLIISSYALSIIRHENALKWEGKTTGETEGRIKKYISSRGGNASSIFYFGERDMASPVSSGSFRTDGMLIVPCSMKTLSGIANGYANTLIERAADVTIKEGRTLLVSPREMPLGAVHLENMLKLARLGVKIAPPIPGFYHKPKDINGIVDFITGKILDAMGVDNNLFKRWEGQNF